MDKQNQNLNQEISILDLLHYFEKIIKKVLSSICDFFKSFIKSILWFFILLKRYFLFILITVIIFGIVGFFNKKVLPNYYNFEMVLAPNFKSTTKLYQQINSYNKLCGNIDSVFFKDLKSISIAPIKTFTNELNIFYDIVHKNSDFYKNDTIFSRQFKINNFKNLLVDTDYPNHIVQITALHKVSPEEIKSKIIDPIEKDPFYKRIKEAHLKSIDIKAEIYKNELNLIDSLLVSIAKGDKVKASGSTISLNGESKTNVEQDLINKTLEITKLLSEKEVEKIQKSQVIKVVSEPQLIDSKSLLNTRNTFSFALTGFLFSILIILLIQFIKFLNKFEKKHF